MMPIDHVTENGERSHGIDEHPLAKHRPAHVRNQDMGNDANAGNDRDVNFRMSEEPEKMLPEKSRTSRMRQQLIIHNQARRYEEAGSRHMVENYQDAGRHEHG